MAQPPGRASLNVNPSIALDWLHTTTCWLGWGLAAAATAYAWLAVVATLRPSRKKSHAGILPPVSILKPLCGAEPRLYDNLRSFCVQDYPDYELIFGVRDADDPAIVVVERLRREFPERHISLVSDPRVHGDNLKVSNLINMLPAAHHGVLVLADSDITVCPDYLASITPLLDDPKVGVVTCLYSGRPIGGLYSRLGALFIDDWFAPSVRLAHLFGSTDFGFGATIALRRDALDAIGGLEAVSDRLADDYWLGGLTRAQGLRTILAPQVVDTDVIETGFSDLMAHELRWMRTIRSIQPWGYAFSFISIPLPIAATGAALSHDVLGAALLALTVSARIVVHYWPRRRVDRKPFSEVWLIPLRDGLTLFVWAVGLVGRRVRWRQQDFSVQS